MIIISCAPKTQVKAANVSAKEKKNKSKNSDVQKWRTWNNSKCQCNLHRRVIDNQCVEIYAYTLCNETQGQWVSEERQCNCGDEDKFFDGMHGCELTQLAQQKKMCTNSEANGKIHHEVPGVMV